MSGVGKLKGCRVLVVEDEGLLSIMQQEMLADMGCEVVATVARFNDAVHQCETAAFDAVLLDINLRGERTFSIAEGLQARGQVFVLVTGYSTDVLPESLRAVPLLQKPYRREDLATALWDALHNK